MNHLFYQTKTRNHRSAILSLSFVVISSSIIGNCLGDWRRFQETISEQVTP